jgi:hypothetical protein
VKNKDKDCFTLKGCTHLIEVVRNERKVRDLMKYMIRKKENWDVKDVWKSVKKMYGKGVDFF